MEESLSALSNGTNINCILLNNQRQGTFICLCHENMRNSATIKFCPIACFFPFCSLLLNFSHSAHVHLGLAFDFSGD